MARNPYEVRDQIRADVGLFSSMDEIQPLDRGQKGASIGVLNSVCGDDEYRRLLLGWLYSGVVLPGGKSTKTFTEGDFYALYNWVSPFKDDEDGKWRSSRPDFATEVMMVLTVVLQQYVHYLKAQPKPPDIELLSMTEEAIDLGGKLRGITE